MSEKIAELQNGYQTVDIEAICNIAHSLKSLSSIIGSSQLHNYFKIIETSCSVCTFEALQNWFKEAEELWVKVRMGLLVIIATEGAAAKRLGSRKKASFLSFRFYKYSTGYYLRNTFSVYKRATKKQGSCPCFFSINV